MYALDAAVRQGLITDADRELRAQRVKHAFTVGELTSLVGDLGHEAAAPPVGPPVVYGAPPPVLPFPERMAPKTQAYGGAATVAKPRSAATGCALIALVIVLLTGGGVIAGLVSVFRSGNDDFATSPASTDPVDLDTWTVGDFDQLVQDYRDQFGDTRVSWVRLASWYYTVGRGQELYYYEDRRFELALEQGGAGQKRFDLGRLDFEAIVEGMELARSGIGGESPYVDTIEVTRLKRAAPTVVITASNAAGETHAVTLSME